MGLDEKGLDRRGRYDPRTLGPVRRSPEEYTRGGETNLCSTKEVRVSGARQCCLWCLSDRGRRLYTKSGKTSGLPYARARSYRPRTPPGRRTGRLR